MTEQEHWDSLSKRYDELYAQVVDIFEHDISNIVKRGELARASSAIFTEAWEFSRNCEDKELMKKYITRFADLLHSMTELMEKGSAPLLDKLLN